MPHSMLIIGGAKSGKSSLAQSTAESWEGRHFFLATATAGDQEMTERIARHQAQRGPLWSTLEEPSDLVGAIKSVDAEDAVILVDCLTLWMGNLMTMADLDDGEIGRRCDALAELLPGLAGRVILVSNEVGMGIVPDNPLSRRFRDLAGALNQRLGRVCDSVLLVAAGLPLTLK